MKIKWKLNPFPYVIIDNYLEESEFKDLIDELENINPIVKSNFSTALEEKNIYENNSLKENSNQLVQRIGSAEIKNIISSYSGNLPVLSLGETENFSGYSTFHITRKRGMLGSHVDHSEIQEGNYLHIANAIFYASSFWQKGWGGETVFFSRNGFSPKIEIDPLPNRLIIFIHTANSFHGVKEYNPEKKIFRKTFYHDFYINKKYKQIFLQAINRNRKEKLDLSKHGTTFIPFFPDGLKNISIRKILSLTNIKYISPYLIYIFNRVFNTKIESFKKIFFINPK